MKESLVEVGKFTPHNAFARRKKAKLFSGAKISFASRGRAS